MGGKDIGFWSYGTAHFIHDTQCFFDIHDNFVLKHAARIPK